MELGMFLIAAAGGILIGFMLGLFIAGAGIANKEADAYSKGYMDGLEVKKGCEKPEGKRKIRGKML